MYVQLRPYLQKSFLLTMKLKNRYGLNHSQEPNTVLRSYLHLRFRLEIIVVRITTTKRSCRLHKYDTIGTVYAHYGLWNLDLSTHTNLPPWRLHFEAARLFFYSSSMLYLRDCYASYVVAAGTAGDDSSQPGLLIPNGLIRSRLNATENVTSRPTTSKTANVIGSVYTLGRSVGIFLVWF